MVTSKISFVFFGFFRFGIITDICSSRYKQKQLKLSTRSPRSPKTKSDQKIGFGFIGLNYTVFFMSAVSF